MAKNNTRQLLLDAGIKLFAEYDYSQVSNKMITDKVEVNSAMISYYFKSKENFYYAVVAHTADTMINKFERFNPHNLEIASAEQLIEQISHGLDIYLEAFFSQEGRDFSIIYHRNLINAVERNIISEYNRPIEIITSRYIKLFNAYYKKVGVFDTNVFFVMRKIASLVYFMILHEHADGIVMADNLEILAKLKDTLLQTVLIGY